MAKVILDLPPELERGLEQIVQSTGRTRNAIVYEALEAYVARQDNTVSDHSLPSPTSIINNDSSRTEDDAWLHADDARAQAEAVRRGRPVFRSLGVGENTELNGENSEDWLRENWPKHFLEKRSASSSPSIGAVSDSNGRHEDNQPGVQPDEHLQEYPLSRLKGIISDTEVNSLNIDEWLRNL